ncbi:MAG: radical SAM protein, partial [Nanoarchaeota archaeon]
MVCIEKIYSVSALVGNGACNANCDFCAGKYLRGDAKENKEFDKNLEASIKLSARYGGWSLSLTSSGEPTCDPNAVTKVLEIYQKCMREGAYFPNVNLFTNGILIANERFSQTYLPLWRNLGLTNVAVSIHSVNGNEQARAYNLSEYPSLDKIIRNTREAGLGIRATLLLRKNGVDNAQKYEHSVNTLIEKGITNITSWPVGNPDGTKNEFTPSWFGLFEIRRWLHKNAKFCHGHVWGGGVYDYNGNILKGNWTLSTLMERLIDEK